MEINGIAHVMLTVRDLGASRPFYRALLKHFGLTEIVDSPVYLYFVGGRTAVGLGERAWPTSRAKVVGACAAAWARAAVDEDPEAQPGTALPIDAACRWRPAGVADGHFALGTGAVVGARPGALALVPGAPAIATWNLTGAPTASERDEPCQREPATLTSCPLLDLAPPNAAERGRAASHGARPRWTGSPPTSGLP